MLFFKIKPASRRTSLGFDSSEFFRQRGEVQGKVRLFGLLQLLLGLRSNGLIRILGVDQNLRDVRHLLLRE